MSWNIVLDPYLPLYLLALLALPGVVLLAYSFWRGARGAPWRLLALVILLVALANPMIHREARENMPDIAVLVVDRSQSQKTGAREDETSAALAHLESRIENEGGIETRIVTVENNPDDGEGTQLFAALEEALADVPRERIAGAVMITDGQLHDVPEKADHLGFDAPLHAIIIGQRNEKDRRLQVTEAPRFGIVGENLDLSFRIDETAAGDRPTGETARVRISLDGVVTTELEAAVGKETTISLALPHAGPNVIEIDVEEGPDELTVLNNRAVVVANGIRDRLRVLLVSGEPHPGERTWRNLLKADPSVDLVHFTILRPPEKQDGTPLEELALIPFPTTELFDEKLDQFDLIIFDRYRRRGVLPIAYFMNIVDYVEKGGAFLAATGPAFATPFSIYRTPLAAILPAQPTGNVTTGGFRPEITPTGKRHPVTADLPGSENTPPDWGQWFRSVDVTVDGGEVVMQTPEGKPLMVLGQAGEGRVAQLLSDHIWLWSRGYEGGGPQAELLRRLAHWLMKEPDLEEENLSASIQGSTLTIKRRSMADDTPPADIHFPSGKVADVVMEEVAPGRFEAVMEARELGLYRITQGEMQTIAAAGPLNPREFTDIRATETTLRPLSHATGGGIWWANENSNGLGIRSVRPGQDASGANWLGLRRNEQYLVHAVHRETLLSGPLALLLILGSLALAWWREGR